MGPKTVRTLQFVQRIGETQSHQLDARVGMDAQIMVVRLHREQTRGPARRREAPAECGFGIGQGDTGIGIGQGDTGFGSARPARK